MLELRNINKSYNDVKVLKNINLKFRKKEFVAILGPSGSGKSTLLNIISGILKKDSGDIFINGVNISSFNNKKLDSYRNQVIGIIFQNYNLIPHISVISNVLMGSIIKGRKDYSYACLLLEQLGVLDCKNKRPSEISGGQAQRVAIARAMINNPDIILADEPTGALDSCNSVQIMKLLKKISKEKLVIMVTHNEELVSNYADRIIRLEDGLVVGDSNKFNGDSSFGDTSLKKNKLLLGTNFKMALNNILTKKFRFFITVLATAIGIIGISLVLALSNGFNMKIKSFEKSTLISLPITINNGSVDNMDEVVNKFPLENFVYSSDDNSNIYENVINQKFLSYLENYDKKIISGISYKYDSVINFVSYNNGYSVFSSSDISMGVIPNLKVIKSQYDLLYGNMPKNKNELLLVVDGNNKINSNILKYFSEDKKISFDDILSKKFKLILNDDYYINNGGYFSTNNNLELLYKAKGEFVNVVGIVRMKKEFPSYMHNSGILYSKDLMDYVVDKNNSSLIVKSLINKDYNVLNGNKLSYEEKELLEAKLGKKSLPSSINIYVNDFNSKERVIKFLDKYNMLGDDKIYYTDQAKLIVSLSNNIISSITVVLIFFSVISLVVAAFMIGIIIYISVLERIKEIGILRALGMSKRNIRFIFLNEAFIIGCFSFIIGLLISRVLLIFINILLNNYTGISNLASFDIYNICYLFILNLIVVNLGAFIPSYKAGNKGIIDCLKD